MSNASPQAAVLAKASGQVYAERQGTRISLAEGDSILSSDTVITDSSGVAEVHFLDGSTASLSPGTSLEVRDFAFGEGVTPSFILNLAQGTMRSVSGEVVKQNPDAFKIVTPQATVGIRGTELFTAVQPNGQEVHAVLHIGKDHIVVITGNDGQSVVMDQALQAVNMQGGVGGMQKQTFQLTEMQQVIQSIAPTQVQKPINPNGPAAPNGAEKIEGQDPAESPAPTSAQSSDSSGASGMVVITHESEAQTAAASAESATNVNTLIRVVESLQSALADAGFSVLVSTGDSFDASLGMSSSVLGDAPMSGGFFGPAPTAPPPVQEVDFSPQVYIINGDYSGNWQADFGSQIDVARPQHITINGTVSGMVAVNVNTVTDSMNTTSDAVNFGHLDGTNGVIAGDSMNIATGDGVHINFGSDVITGSSMGGDSKIFGDTSAAVGSGTGTVVLGNDTIIINGAMTGNATIYSDVPDAAKGNYTYTGGNDTITVGSMSGASLIVGGVGDDQITVHGSVTESSIISGGAGNDSVFIGGGVSGNSIISTHDGNDSITAGNVSGAAKVQGGAGEDSIRVGNVSGSVQVSAGADNDNITINGSVTENAIMGAGGGNDIITITGNVNGNSEIQGNAGNDTITITGTVSENAAIFGEDGNDTITIGTLSGGTVSVGAGSDTLIINAMSGGKINMASATGVSRIYNDSLSSMNGNILTAKFDGGTTLILDISGLGLTSGDPASIMRQLLANGLEGVTGVPTGTP